MAAACVLLSVTFQIFDTDFWQHLLVGKAIWSLHHVPTTQLWSWPTYGTPDVNSSWGFRFLLWPFWSQGGVWGLYAWRWTTTLTAFAVLWITARRMGATGLTTLIVLVACSLIYRQRSLVRPETLVAVLLALELWILETRRTGGPDRSPWLIAVALVWANVHISWTLGFVVLGAYLVGESWGGRPARGQAPLTRRVDPLVWILVAALVASLVNPFGWRALAQPFEFFLHQRQEPLYRSIPELQPLPLARNLTNLLPLWFLTWPVLIVWRARRFGLDRVEALLAVCFLPLALVAQRFLGFTVIVAAPFVARDLDAWVRSRGWPAWTRVAWARAALVAATCVLIGIPEWSRAAFPIGVGIRYEQYPVGASDFMAANGVRGQGFNPFYLGGYLLYRFWPDPGRLPFMDIHMTGTREDRTALAYAGTDPAVWRDLDRRHAFDWVMLRRIPYPGDHLLEIVERDTAFSLVFMDDAGVLFVRRHGPLAGIAERFGYRALGAGTERLAAASARMVRDPAARDSVIRELEREAAGSRFDALALTRLGAVRLLAGDTTNARAALERALERDPHVANAHQRLAAIALAQRRPVDALRELRAERANGGLRTRFDLESGKARQQMGDLRGARESYRRALRLMPGDREAADSLRSVEQRLAGGT